MSDAAKMQEASGPERIRFAASPLDPLAGRFTLERSLTRAPLHFPNAAAAEDAPLAAALFAVGGVRAVQIADGVVTVTRAVEASWDGLKAPLAAAIRAALTHDAPLGADGARPPVARRSDAELRETVQTVLDRAANPAIAAHRGRVDVVDVVDGELWLRMSGGCQGCAASTATLRDGVERMVRAAVPEIVSIVDVTDHDAGLTPYYSHDSGAPASPLARAVPEGVISLEDGRHVVDSAYLAPRLGLDVGTLRVEMRAGRVRSSEERGEGEDADCVRLTFRHGDRAWSALIRPDGRVIEIPPPLDPEPTNPERDAALAAGVRAFLEALPPDAASVGYAQLADALDVSPPHRVGQVVRALEITMGEDAAAGRPFLAALVVGRARGGLPARGFYDRAVALGRGPEPGETEAAFLRPGTRRDAGVAGRSAVERAAARGVAPMVPAMGWPQECSIGSALSIALTVPLMFRKRGGRKLVVTPDGAPWAPRPRVDNAMVKALARAFRWRKELDSGVYSSLDDLAAAKSIAASYVSRVLRLTLLAPDMVEAILDGRQPAELQLDDLLEGFPLDWEGQRRAMPTSHG